MSNDIVHTPRHVPSHCPPHFTMSQDIVTSRHTLVLIVKIDNRHTYTDNQENIMTDFSQNIPSIHSIHVAWYLDKYIDWDEELERYVSKSIKGQRQEKEEAIDDMYSQDSLCDPSIEELEFLYQVECDQCIKVKLFKLVKFWRRAASHASHASQASHASHATHKTQANQTTKATQTTKVSQATQRTQATQTTQE